MSHLVHSDNFVSTGSEEDLEYFDQGLKTLYQIKTLVIGHAVDLDEEVRVLNRIVRWHPGQGARLSADPRHAEVRVGDLDGPSGRSVSTLSAKESAPETEVDKDKDTSATEANGTFAKKFKNTKE